MGKRINIRGGLFAKIHAQLPRINFLYPPLTIIPLFIKIQNRPYKRDFSLIILHKMKSATK